MHPAQFVLYPSPGSAPDFAVKAVDAEILLVVIAASRGQFAQLLNEAAGKSGLYVLQASDSTIYVGQSQELAGRLSRHHAEKKIGFVRGFLMTREHGIAGYLDYGEGRLYEVLAKQGFILAQTSLAGTLEKHRERLVATMEAGHVLITDKLVGRFLAYATAFGLTHPSNMGLATEVFSENEGDDESSDAEDVSTGAAIRAGVVRKPPSTLFVLDDSGRPVADGEIGQRPAFEVFADCIIAAGLEKVEALSLLTAGEPLVSRNQHEIRRSQSHERNGWYILTHSSTVEKERTLKVISAKLSLGWTVTITPRLTQGSIKH